MARKPGPGRPRKSVADHVANGTYRPSLHGPRPAVGGTSAAGPVGPPPVKPDDLSPGAAAAWDRVVAAVGPRIRASDRDSLVQLCEWSALFETALADAHKAGPGDRVKCLTAVGIASTNWERLARKFGLSPEDRGRLSPMADAPAVDGREARFFGSKVRTRPPTTLDRKGKPS